MEIINENTIREIVRSSLLSLFENSDKFNVFRNHFSKFVQQTLNMANKELQKYDLSVEINTEYEFFDDDHWLACYERTSGYIEEGIIMIALNEKKIYDCMVDLGTDEDLLEIELQAIITIMHEVGHGIVDWYRYQFEGEETTSELINNIVYCDEDEEEDLCEEFGESWASSYTGVYNSTIAKSLTEYDNVDIV